jgi:hypothetical protein
VRITTTEVWRPEVWRPEVWRPEVWRPEVWRPEVWRPEVWRPEVWIARKHTELARTGCGSLLLFGGERFEDGGPGTQGGGERRGEDRGGARIEEG